MRVGMRENAVRLNCSLNGGLVDVAVLTAAVVYRSSCGI